MRRSSRIALGSLLTLSTMSWMFAVGCGGGDDDDNNNPGVDAGLDSTTPFDAEPGVDATFPDASKDAGGDVTVGDSATGPEAGPGGGEAGADSSTEAGPGAGDAGDAGDAAVDAGHDAGDAGDAGADAGSLPLYHTVGRWETNAGNANVQSAAWPGSGLTVSFTGTTLGLFINSTANANTVSHATYSDFVGVYFDGKPTMYRVAIPAGATTAAPAVTNLSVNAALAAGAHTAQIYKLTDADISTINIFTGVTNSAAGTPFELAPGGTITPAASPFTTKIEFIGDEQTAGWGASTAATGCVGTETPYQLAAADIEETSSPASYVAQFFNAERINVSTFQMGATANGYGATDDVVNTYWPRILPYGDTTPTWDYTKFIPKAVVVNLGSLTDLGSDSDAVPASYVSTYATFLEGLYTKYTVNGVGPYIVIVEGPEITGDANPTDPTQAQITAFQNANTQVAAAFTTATKSSNISVVIAPTYASGCDYYPNATANQATAKAVEDALAKFFGVTAP